MLTSYGCLSGNVWVTCWKWEKWEKWDCDTDKWLMTSLMSMPFVCQQAVEQCLIIIHLALKSSKSHEPEYCMTRPCASRCRQIKQRDWTNTLKVSGISGLSRLFTGSLVCCCSSFSFCFQQYICSSSGQIVMMRNKRSTEYRGTSTRWDDHARREWAVQGCCENCASLLSVVLDDWSHPFGHSGLSKDARIFSKASKKTQPNYSFSVFTWISKIEHSTWF